MILKDVKRNEEGENNKTILLASSGSINLI